MGHHTWPHVTFTFTDEVYFQGAIEHLINLKKNKKSHKFSIQPRHHLMYMNIDNMQIINF